MNFSPTELCATTLFAIAIIHTFCTAYFEKLAAHSKRHAGLLHMLGEVEIVFGLWAAILILFIWAIDGFTSAKLYLNECNYTEPMFVFAIMVVAGSKPILDLTNQILNWLSQLGHRLLRVEPNTALYFLTLSITPLMGSFITEPAAMTIAAFLLRDLVYRHRPSTLFMFATLGVLFVNISIGGTLTNFAAPPVLMVANTWQWDSAFMLSHFGIKSTIAVLINALLVSVLFHKNLVLLELERLKQPNQTGHARNRIPFSVTVIHLFFLCAIVLVAHDPVLFIWLLLFFIGYTVAYPKYQNPLILREALLVSFFLAGLVVLGKLQAWWLQPLLTQMSPNLVFYGGLALTAITDNAALTYLGSLVTGTSAEFKLALVGGAVAGGGLTVIANAPNPAGIAILRSYFPNLAVSASYLLLAALPPTFIAILAYRLF